MLRRPLVLGLGSACLARPAVSQRRARDVLRFIPQIDLAVLDPHVTPAYVTRNHGYLVFDTLYGEDGHYRAQPQMVEGHLVGRDGLEWLLRLRPGLLWHDGEPVLARDCVASIRRWGRRDPFGGALLAATDELAALDDRTLRFRLKRPFPHLPAALGKAASFMPAMMPERLATTDVAVPITEMVGSGPFRFRADERLPGARAVYERFAAYRPREGGTTERTAGPKVAHIERVEWTTIPDPATAAAALRTGEQDWWEYTSQDLAPPLRRDPAIRVRVLEPAGMLSMLRPNHLLPPFDNPAIRRALLGAFDQTRVMQAIVGTDASQYHVPLGVFCPGMPMASEAGLEPLTAPPDRDRVRTALREAGYDGSPVLLMAPADYVTGPLVAQVVMEALQAVGMPVDLAVMDQGTLLRRRTRRQPVAQGGWNLFVTSWAGLDWANPVGHVALRGDGDSYPGWSRSPRTESLRAAWLEATDLAQQQSICAEIQRQSMLNVPFYPLGQYVQPTAHRREVEGLLDGFPVFWNLRKG